MFVAELTGSVTILGKGLMVGLGMIGPAIGPAAAIAEKCCPKR